MVKISWCLKQSKGIKIIEPKNSLVEGYLRMAQGSIGTMNREKDKNIIFSVSAGYYALYYSLYAILQKIGIKCEIHACSIEFMKRVLKGYYSKGDIDLIEIAFLLRNNLQYYVDKSVNKNEVDFLLKNAYDFFVKSRDIVNKLTPLNIKEIRDEIK